MVLNIAHSTCSSTAFAYLDFSFTFFSAAGKNFRSDLAVPTQLLEGLLSEKVPLPLLLKVLGKFFHHPGSQFFIHIVALLASVYL